MSPAELVATVGEALFGPRWQTDLAGALGVSDRTMRRWAAGTDVPRVDVLTDLRRLVLSREDRLREVDNLIMSTNLTDFRAAGPRAA